MSEQTTGAGFFGTPLSAIPADHMILTALAIGDEVVFDRSFTDHETAVAALAAQAEDPDDPNPLPQLYLDRGAAEPVLRAMSYNPVLGLSLGPEGLPADAPPQQIIAMVEDA